ncbi:hypothetical protein DPEC_G00311440 [Dallia pectoralis]|uniref:Uncharacterized protein n=1 Tax=Dallia pectoralis TaxID=75939 RepID=A0ACC2FBJ5_DALPE|nr:hypothetical protein DPEC_G00311440 [Dallia pectoralis]
MEQQCQLITALLLLSSMPLHVVLYRPHGPPTIDRYTQRSKGPLPRPPPANLITEGTSSPLCRENEITEEPWEGCLWKTFVPGTLATEPRETERGFCL